MLRPRSHQCICLDWPRKFFVWTSPLTGLARLSDKFTTGSSIMPQKRNPDAAELVRAKAGRMIGALDTLIVMKGLPLAYAKDMQEDKQGAMDALAALSLSIAAMAGMVADLEPDAARMKKAAGEGYATATDLADWLVRTSIYRSARRITLPAGSSPGPPRRVWLCIGFRWLPCARLSRESPTMYSAFFRSTGR